MRKLILKTISYTLLCVFAVSLIAFSVLTLFFPGILADFSYSVGNKKTCVWYTEMQYNKKKSIGTLNTLVYRVKWLDNDEKIIKYSSLLINDGGFDKLCENVDSSNKDNPLIKGAYRDYIYSDYVAAMYRKNRVTEAIAFASNDLSNGKYNVYNAYETLLYETYRVNDKTNLERLVNLLESFLPNLSGADKERANDDLVIFKAYLGEK